MCVVSFVGDHYRDEFDKKLYKPWETPWYPNYPPAVYPGLPGAKDIEKYMEKIQQTAAAPSNAELEKQINDLRKQVEEMKRFLIEAIEYDKVYKQPNCENELKIAFLKKVAESVGMTLDDIFPPAPTKPTPPPNKLVKGIKIPKKSGK